jgi:NAD(P)-dependent dehydrogenase (short-subunit alcohol dehydrogenase family)
MANLKGKVALVTGAASGIGKASAIELARAGAMVVFADIAVKAGKAAAAGAGGVFVRCDVSKAGDCARAVGFAVRRFGGLDILHANAGIQFGKTVEETTEKEWECLMEVNLKGVFLSCRAAIPAMRKRGGGSIIVTSSVNGMMAEPKLAAYCASKGALIMLVKAMAVDHARDGIRVNALAPGWVETPINTPYLSTAEDRAAASSVQPAGRIARPGEMGKAVAFLASGDASFITGAVLTADGGATACLNGHRFGA